MAANGIWTPDGVGMQFKPGGTGFVGFAVVDLNLERLNGVRRASMKLGESRERGDGHGHELLGLGQ